MKFILLSLCALFTITACGPGTKVSRDGDKPANTNGPTENHDPCSKELMSEIKSINDKDLGIRIAQIASSITDADAKKEFIKLKNKCDSLLKNNQQHNGCVFTDVPGGVPRIFNNDFCILFSPK